MNPLGVYHPNDPPWPSDDVENDLDDDNDDDDHESYNFDDNDDDLSPNPSGGSKAPAECTVFEEGLWRS